MRVLLAAPTSSLKDYCIDDWAKMVRNLTYPNLDILLVDNSADETYYHKILEAGLLCFRVPPTQHPVDFITNCQNIIREYFLRGKYDFLFSLETDVFVPKNIIEYLIAYQAPVINVSYMVTQDGKDTMCIQGRTGTANSNRVKLITFNEAFHLYDGQIKELNSMRIGCDFQMMGTGIGCTLIRADVLEEMGFRVDKRKGLAVFSDTFFHLDLQQRQISDLLDTSLVVEHRRQDWRKLKFN
jgi:hypothetical protein